MSKIDDIKINPEWMGHVEKGIPQPYFSVLFVLLILLLGMTFIWKLVQLGVIK